jgi:hypothetical protein
MEDSAKHGIVILLAARLLLLVLVCQPRHDLPKVHSSSTPRVILASNTEHSTNSWIPTSAPTRLSRNLARKTKARLSTLAKHMTKSCFCPKVRSLCPVAPRGNAISKCRQDGTETGKLSITETSPGCVYGTTLSSRAGSTSSKISHRVSQSRPALLSRAHPPATQRLLRSPQALTQQLPHLK